MDAITREEATTKRFVRHLDQLDHLIAVLNERLIEATGGFSIHPCPELSRLELIALEDAFVKAGWDIWLHYDGMSLNVELENPL